MKQTTYRCDVTGCNREYSATNGWYLIIRGDGYLIITPWQRATPEDVKRADFHLCGREHLGTKESELLNQLSGR